MRARRTGLPPALLLAALFQVLPGCAPDGPAQERRAAAPPQGAVRVADDLYMVPIDRDRDGCERFRAWSATRMTAAVIHYRAQGGGFTMLKREAACGTPKSR